MLLLEPIIVSNMGPLSSSEAMQRISYYVVLLVFGIPVVLYSLSSQNKIKKTAPSFSNGMSIGMVLLFAIPGFIGFSKLNLIAVSYLMLLIFYGIFIFTTRENVIKHVVSTVFFGLAGFSLVLIMLIYNLKSFI
ncbi:hypothetical protein [Leptobacterium sp. I13]|uniref:hypothetical protein n=1 Tax=Leptobacterium meishanense TaxID=3128904 RepID=UPI0030ECAFF7